MGIRLTAGFPHFLWKVIMMKIMIKLLLHADLKYRINNQFKVKFLKNFVEKKLHLNTQYEFEFV